MSTFLIITFLFIIGAIGGWVIELFFRRFFSAKKWINPGFLTGPYVPLYGFGLVSLFAMSRINLGFIENIYLQKAVLILFMAIVVTFIEYLAGLIFIKGLKTKLWDYSDRKGNIQVIICPLFSFFWLIICGIYNLLVDPYIYNLVFWFENNIMYSFFVGIVLGIMLIDFANSLNIANRIKKFADEYHIIVKWEFLKSSIANEAREAKEKVHFLFPFKSKKSIKENIEYYLHLFQEKIKNKKINK